MVTISPDDAQQLVARLTQAEESIAELQTRIEAQSIELAASNARHNNLITDLQTLLGNQEAEFQQMKLVQEELRQQVEALARGSGGVAGKKLVDTCILGKPSFFHGKQTEWRDWSYILTIFIGAVDEVMVERMRDYAKRDTITLMADMSSEDRRLSEELG